MIDTNDTGYTVRPAGRLRGQIAVPGDKSISHRALLFNALAGSFDAPQQVRATNFLPGADCFSTLGCLRALNVDAQIDLEEDGTATARVTARGPFGLREATDVLDAGNSGTTIRLLSGILSGFPYFSVVTGDASLRRRPMRRVADPLRQMGVTISGRQGGNYAPLAITGGNLKGFEYALPVASAQLKSALLLAGLFAEGTTRLTGKVASRDHTERMLAAMGAPIRVEPDVIEIDGLGWGAVLTDAMRDGIEAHVMRIMMLTSLTAINIDVPGDISSAAFWLVGASLHPDADITLVNVGLNPTRTGIIDVLLEMGANIEIVRQNEVAGEPVGDLRVRTAQHMRGVTIGGDIVPRLIDEAPALAVAAAFADGRTELHDAAELRLKESDRIASMTRELSRLGARIAPLDDGYVIQGDPSLIGSFGINSAAVRVTCDGDHRLAMSLATYGLVAGSGALGGSAGVAIDDPACAAVSYPTFWRDLENARA